MNFPQEPHALPSRELYFRLADRLQLQACLQAIEQEGKSVVLHSDHPALLDHYGQILVQRLRQHLPDTPTEIFFPTHTDALLARFNEVLSHVSVDAATQTEGPAAPAKLWIVHDASALPEHELKLLARLLQHLPGARVSAVLMLNGSAQALRDFDPQGRRLLRWHIEPPTPEQIDQMVQEARQNGREFAALELVARVAPPAPAQTPVNAKAARPAPPSEPVQALATERPQPSAPGAGRLWRWLGLFLGLLMLSAGVAAWLNPETTRQWGAQLGQLWTHAPRDMGGPVSPASAASEPASSTQPPASAAETASAPTMAASQAGADAPPAPAPAASAPPPAPLLTELPELAQRGLAWLRQQDKDSWIIEHSRHASAQLARKQVGSGLLSNARIVPVYRPGAEAAEFAVITGPFRSEERARNFTARNGLGPSTQVHASGKLLSMTQPASASADRSRP